MDGLRTNDLSAAEQTRLLALVSDLVCTLDADGTVRGVNAAWGRVLGREAGDVVGRPFPEVVVAADRAAAATAIRALAAGDTLSGVTLRLPAGAGGERIVSWWGAAEPGEALCLAGRDVTREERLDADLAAGALRLERVAGELQELAYVASHDLAEPLRMVTSYLDLLARRYEGELDDRAHVFIHYAVDGAQRMRGLIDDLLTYSRAGTTELETRTVDVAALLDDLLPGLGEDGAAVRAPEILAPVHADPVMLGQVLRQLLANAIRFRSPDRPLAVTVASAAEAGGTRLDVADNGLGIDPAQHERIFRVFGRLHGRDEYPGTGIGLAVCRRLAERHGGRIWVTSPGGSGAPGSTFHVWLPGPS